MGCPCPWDPPRGVEVIAGQQEDRRDTQVGVQHERGRKGICWCNVSENVGLREMDRIGETGQGLWMSGSQTHPDSLAFSEWWRWR